MICSSHGETSDMYDMNPLFLLVTGRYPPGYLTIDLMELDMAS